MPLSNEYFQNKYRETSTFVWGLVPLVSAFRGSIATASRLYEQEVNSWETLKSVAYMTLAGVDFAFNLSAFHDLKAAFTEGNNHISPVGAIGYILLRLGLAYANTKYPTEINLTQVNE